MERLDVMMRLAALAEQCGEKPSDFRLEFTVKTLMPLGADKVCEALERLMQSARRFPTVAEIKAEMGEADLTPDDEARMIVESIMKGVRQFGEVPPGNQRTPEAIRLAIGDGAWEVVCRSGGWNAVIERAGENEMAFRAQVRDLASAYLRTGVIERGTLPDKIPSAYQALTEANRQHALALPEAPQMSPEGRLLLEAKIADLKRERSEIIAASERAIEVAKETLRAKGSP